MCVSRVNISCVRGTKAGLQEGVMPSNTMKSYESILSTLFTLPALDIIIVVSICGRLDPDIIIGTPKCLLYSRANWLNLTE